MYLICVLQKDHVWTSVNEVMSRYKPPVEDHRWNIQFVPVVESKLNDREIKDLLRYDSRLVIMHST